MLTPGCMAPDGACVAEAVELHMFLFKRKKQRSNAGSLATAPIGFMHIHKTAGGSIRRLSRAGFGKHGLCRHHYDYQLAADPDAARYSLFLGHFSLPILLAQAPDIRLYTFLREPRSRLTSIVSFFSRAGRRRRQQIDAGQIRADQVPCAQLKLAEMTHEEAFLSDDPDILRSLDNVQARLLAGASFGRDAITRNQVFSDQIGGDIVERSTSNLSLFEAIGLVERMQESVGRLCRTFGWPRPTNIPWTNRTQDRKSPNLSAEAERRLEDLTWMDRAVYEAASRRFDSDAVEKV